LRSSSAVRQATTYTGTQIRPPHTQAHRGRRERLLLTAARRSAIPGAPSASLPPPASSPSNHGGLTLGRCPPGPPLPRKFAAAALCLLPSASCLSTGGLPAPPSALASCRSLSKPLFHSGLAGRRGGGSSFPATARRPDLGTCAAGACAGASKLAGAGSTASFHSGLTERRRPDRSPLLRTRCAPFT
jgi:hypothetical protein